MIKKDLDGELPDLPPKKKIQKENEGYFDVDKKHVVIGEQLPKMYLFFDVDNRKPKYQLENKTKRKLKML